MTPMEAWNLIRSGRFLLVGNLRACDVQESGFVDRKSGLAEKTLLITYFIECQPVHGFEIVKVTRRLPLGEDERVEAIKAAVKRGALYAFHILGFEKKIGFTLAKLAGTAEPILIEESEYLGDSGA